MLLGPGRGNQLRLSSPCNAGAVRSIDRWFKESSVEARCRSYFITNRARWKPRSSASALGWRAPKRWMFIWRTRIRGVPQSQGDDARGDHRGSEDLRRCAAAAARDSPPGLKWSFVPRNSPKPRVHRGQRRRIRARHVQRPPADGVRSASVDRRHSDREPRGGCARRLHLYTRRISLPDREDGSRASTKLTRAATWATTSPARASSSICTRTPARALMSAAKRRRCSIRSKASAASLA